ncbi:putative ferric-chelate reductase 1 [Dissostichus eleginoides]|uniref:Ferric-chelate reductase 1 n=1 Tax=Dissostichus eleginoides TaxID=100907 RepID=A0AAD9BD50_DISEL|nr:putative ferric-chelate reductase 1 [Dissostichus eleginoides]
MEGGLIVLAAALLLFLSPDVQGTSHLSFSNNTQVNITRDGCGVSKLCVETPNNCDPSGNSPCLFVSAVSSVPVPPNGVDLSVELSGESAGYIAVGLTANASEGTSMLFICAQNSSDNGTFFFRTMQMNNTSNMLTPTERRVKEIRGLNGNMIKCEFTVPNVNASNTRSSEDTTFFVLLGNGSFDGSDFGLFIRLLDSKPLDLTKPDSNVPAPTTMPNNTTMPNKTTMPNNSGALQPHAVLLLLSVLTLSVLLRV